MFVAEQDAKGGGHLGMRLYTADGVYVEDLFNTNSQGKRTLQDPIQGAIG